MHLLTKIGDVAHQYEISNRTLRYWEDAGILSSVRKENGYRYYDEKNRVRIQQIMVLRKLKVSIQDIEKIFEANHIKTAVFILQKHLNSIQLEISELDHLLINIETLIRQIESFSGSELIEHKNSDFIIGDAFLEVLSERKMEMSKNLSKLQMGDVRIINLPKMVFACYRAESASPEEDCWKIMNGFIQENNLLEQYGFRHFGFNNPDPTEGSPIYGYEMWVTIPKELSVPMPLYKKEFSGGSFGAIPTYMTEIGERWQQLWQWAMNDVHYEVDWDIDKDRRWLEECIDYQLFNDPTVGPDKKQLDLLVPIRTKAK